MRERTAATDELTYLHGDHLGSASLATDASGGVVSETHAASLCSLGGLGQVRYFPRTIPLPKIASHASSSTIGVAVCLRRRGRLAGRSSFTIHRSPFAIRYLNTTGK